MDAENPCAHFSFDVSTFLVRLDKQVRFYFGTCHGSDRSAARGRTAPCRRAADRSLRRNCSHGAPAADSKPDDPDRTLPAHIAQSYTRGRYTKKLRTFLFKSHHHSPDRFHRFGWPEMWGSLNIRDRNRQSFFP